MMRHSMILTFFVLLLCSFSLTTSAGLAQSAQGVQLRTIVIDPGHGGRDPGTVSPSGKSLEKNITLPVALKLGKMIQDAYPDVTVLYTRKTDVLIPLASRTDFANKNHADLFISIHANSIKNNPTPSGSETFIMGTDKSASNMEVSKLENSVIVYEEDYSTTYQGFDPNNPESYIIFNLLQNAHMEQSLLFASMVQKALGSKPIPVNRGVKQGPFLVLYRSTMPAVLVELGFLSNTKDRMVLISEEGQNKLAAALFEAFKRYKTGYDKQHQPMIASASNSNSENSGTNIAAPPVAQQTTKDPAGAVYRVQIFAIGKLLPSNASDFKGYGNISHVKAGNLYKYRTGSFSSREEAQAYCNKVRKDFPQAFVVEEP